MEAIRKIILSVRDAVVRIASVLRKIGLPIVNILTFNASDERISYRKELCVAINRTGVSVAYGTRIFSSISTKRVKHYPSEERDYPTPKEVVTCVALAVSELRADRINISSVALSIPKTWVVIKMAEFPLSVKENISDVVNYELDRLVPFTSEEALYDFSLMGETAEKITIFIAAAKADLIGNYSDALKELGLTVDRVTLNLMSLGTLCRSLSKKRDFLFIGTDGDEYEGALFLRGFPASVVNGRFSSDDYESRADTIAADMKPLVDAAKGAGNAPHLFALLSSPPGREAALKERLQTSLGLSVSLLTANFALPGMPGQDNASYAAAGGVMESLQPGPPKLNLLSKGKQESARIYMGLTVVLASLLVILWAMYLVAPIQVEKKRLMEIDRQVKRYKGTLKEVETLKKQIDALNSEIETIVGFKENSPMALAILKELTTILPKSTWLTRVRIDQSSVDIEGYASSASELLPRLEASKYFTKAEFSSPTFRDVRMNSDRFNIKVQIRGVPQKKEVKEEKGVPHKNAKK